MLYGWLINSTTDVGFLLELPTGPILSTMTWHQNDMTSGLYPILSSLTWHQNNMTSGLYPILSSTTWHQNDIMLGLYCALCAPQAGTCRPTLLMLWFKPLSCGKWVLTPMDSYFNLKPASVTWSTYSGSICMHHKEVVRPIKPSKIFNSPRHSPRSEMMCFRRRWSNVTSLITSSIP